jgi:cytochrome c biogenesis protein CcdA
MGADCTASFGWMPPLSTERRMSAKVGRVAALVVLAITVGLADSINPSTVLPALVLATRRDPVRNLILFTGGVFCVYLAGGVLLTLGPGQAIRSALPRPSRAATGLVELSLGIALVLVAIGLWSARGRIARHFARRTLKPGRSSMVLGAAIMSIELPTAFPYFALIAAIVASRRNVANEVALLVIFNVAFVTPLLLIAATLLTGVGSRTHERLRVQLDRRAPALIPSLVFTVALVLIVLGTVGLIAE